MKKKITEYDFPNDLKDMSLKELKQLSVEIRDFLVDKVSQNGGHLASNLGVVELSIALHKFFDSPNDKIIWDVGHQSYVHKILTGRAEDFDSLRQMGGLSGFPRIIESEHDFFDMGHSSTSISLAMGMASARDLKKEEHSIIAVIGDGALTGGLAYEALNNAGASKSNIIVVLNDNGMSISKNTGSISQHLSKLRTSKGYLNLKNQVKNALKGTPGLYQGMEHFRDSIKYAIVDGVLFEEMGFTYLGPIDGHNIKDLLNTLAFAKNVDGPVLVHAITKKGKGYIHAEENPNKFHGIAPFDKISGELITKSTSKSFSSAFGDKLCELAIANKNVVSVCAAMISGTGLEKFAEMFPDRTFDVGIAEEYAVSFAAGLAKAGYRPFVAIYSTFLQRAYDEIMIDVCLNNLPVVFAIDRAGNVGQDGETHHGIFDISYLSHMPNLTILSPRDANELSDMLDYAMTLSGPCAIRYPRGTSYDNYDMHQFDGRNYFIVNESNEKRIVGKSKKADAEIWASGKMVQISIEAREKLKARGYKINIVNTAIIKPFDAELLYSAIDRTKNIITLEDNVIEGGMGQIINNIILENNLDLKVKNLGWPNCFVEHGNTDSLFTKYRLDAHSVAERICEFIEG